MSKKFIIGVDEAGRGPLAGPVTAAAVLIPIDYKPEEENPGTGIRDSKKYSEKQREEWIDYIQNDPNIIYEHSSVWQNQIDKLNIARATHLAATRAVRRIINRNNINLKETDVLLDGSLKLNIKNISYEVIIKGDETIDAIKLASIVAKTKRDESMKRLHKKHSIYDFLSNKGYGTKYHRVTLQKHGPCKYHRTSFLSFLEK